MGMQLLDMTFDKSVKIFNIERLLKNSIKWKLKILK